MQTESPQPPGLPAMPSSHFPDFDAAGSVSIVLQGGLSDGNLVETANHCRHWRQLFPKAEIILSLSGSSVLDGWVQDGILREPRLIARLAHDTAAHAAFDAISANVDVIARAGGATPLPPIKSDSDKGNNINLQISAARNGLAHATGEYVLRVRSDLIFLDRTFLDQFLAGAALPRGDAAALRSRVLISWLYTLNPYTQERLPLHLSDWFHFGFLEDVRRLWDIPMMELADAIHYMAHPFAEHSNQAERLFNVRLADEQFIAFNAMRKLLPDLRLDYHNDHSGLTRCMDALLDNFTLSDLVQAKCIFAKYSFEFDRHEKKLHCITPLLWRRLVDNRQVDYRSTMAEVIEEASWPARFEMSHPFPRVYEAARLKTKSGQYMNGVIAADHDGILVRGPQVTMPKGRYVAHIDGRILDGEGSVTLRATVDQGQRVLATRTIMVAPGTVAQPLELPFEIATNLIGALEIVCETCGVRQAVVHRLVLQRVEANHGRPAVAPPAARHSFAPGVLAIGNGVLVGDAVANAAPSGLLARTPAMALAAGAWRATITATGTLGTGGEMLVQVADNRSRFPLAEQVFSFAAVAGQANFEVPFQVDAAEAGSEITVACTIKGVQAITLHSVMVEPDLRLDRLANDGASRLTRLLRQLQR